MKRANDFVSVNPNSPKKRRRKKAQERDYGELVRFGSTGMALDFPSTRSLLTSGGPWTPLPDFRAWDSSKQSGSKPSDYSLHSMGLLRHYIKMNCLAAHILTYIKLNCL